MVTEEKIIKKVQNTIDFEYARGFEYLKKKYPNLDINSDEFNDLLEEYIDKNKTSNFAINSLIEFSLKNENHQNNRDNNN